MTTAAEKLERSVERDKRVRELKEYATKQLGTINALVRENAILKVRLRKLTSEQQAKIVAPKTPTVEQSTTQPAVSDPSPPVTLWGPIKQEPGGQPYRTGTSTGVTLPEQP